MATREKNRASQRKPGLCHLDTIETLMAQFSLGERWSKLSCIKPRPRTHPTLLTRSSIIFEVNYPIFTTTRTRKPQAKPLQIPTGSPTATRKKPLTERRCRSCSCDDGVQGVVTTGAARFRGAFGTLRGPPWGGGGELEGRGGSLKI